MCLTINVQWWFETMAENLNKRPSKSILKSSTSFEKPEAAPKKKHKETKWDEMNIIATLHPPDKDYGHMKIEEPKTPFNYEVGEEDEPDGLDADLLAEKIELGASQPLKVLERMEVDPDSESDEEDTPEERERRKQFESKRKAHYNEYYAVKLARKLMDQEEDEDEEEDDDGSSGGSSPEPFYCGVESCPGHKKKTERCERAGCSRTAVKGSKICDKLKSKPHQQQ